MPDGDGPAVMSTRKMAAAELRVAEETPLAARTAGWGCGRQRCPLHREQESVKLLVRAPRQEWQGGGPQTGPPRPRPRWRGTRGKEPEGLATVGGALIKNF